MKKELKHDLLVVTFVVFSVLVFFIALFEGAPI